MMSGVMRMIAMRCASWHDDLWLIDSTPVECGRSRETAKRSNLAGWAGYGYCASHSRYFWGLRLHLMATPSGLPIAFAISNPKMDEREIARDLLDIDPSLLAGHAGQILMADKGYRSKEFDAVMADLGIELIRPATKAEPARPGQRFLKPFRQIIESVNQTLKAPARPGTPRRTELSRCCGPGVPEAPCPHLSDLAQRDHQPACASVTHRVRSLTGGLGTNHLGSLRWA